MFDYLDDLVTNNLDGTVTIGGVTYATDGSGIIENYGATDTITDGLTRAQRMANDAAVNDPFGTMAANAFMEELPDGTKVFNPAGDGTDFGQLLISGGAEPSDDDTITGAGNDIIDGGAGNDIIDGGAGNDTVDGSTGTDTVDGSTGTDTVDGSGSGTNNDNVDQSLINAIDIFKSNTDLSGNTLSQISGLTDNLRLGLQDAQVTQNADGTFFVTTRDGSVIQYQPDGSNPVLISDTNYENSSLASSLTGDTSSENYGNVTIDDIYDYLKEGGLESSGIFLQQGSMTPEQVAQMLVGDRLTGFQNLMKNFDRSAMPEFTGDYTYNPYNPDFGAGTGRNQVYYIDPTTNKPAMGLASEINALYPGITTYNSPMDLSQQNPGSFDDTTTTDTTTNTDINFEDLYYSLLNQNQSSNDTIGQTIQTGSQDMSGLVGLLNQFMQSRNSLQGGGRYNNMYGTMYGGGMGYGSPYGNPFNSGMGYGYGMNPYSGGIGSFYGNTGLGFSPSGYNSGYGSGYGMNNMFYGGFGGNNYNQQQMAYNPYSSLYNQLSNPQTYGYSGDVYTPEYNSYLNTQYEGDRYSQGYQDYLQSNNPGVYSNLFGGSV